MPQFQMRNTVERLDKPSSYAMSKVRLKSTLSFHPPQLKANL